MSPFGYVAVFVASLLVSAVLVSLSRRVAFRLDALDHPDGGRKTQAVPIPRLGGVAVALALTLVWASATLLFVGKDGIGLLLGVMLPGVAMAVLGLIDDRRNLNPWVRLGVQALIATGALLGGSRIGLTSSEWVNGVLFILWVMVIVNAINLLDNSDGLAGSTVLVSSLASATVALIFGQFLVAALAFALAGVAAGFLWHNWYPATVYLGDSGAYFLGFMLAVVIVRLRPSELSPIQALAIAVLLVALPLVDLIYVVTRRLVKGVHPFTAGRDHLSHTVQRRGVSVPKAVLTLEAFLVMTSGLAVLLAVVAF
jgi:UDP-GlcNAc:undecaprenyl-phosphate GlcNAc-1-phosphate transferase